MDYTIRELSIKLNVNRATIEKWLHEGVFPNACKQGKMWSIPETDVNDLVKVRGYDNSENIELIKLRKEVVGKTYGALTVIEVTGYKQETKTNRRLNVEVGCECGVIKEIPYYKLQRGAQKYCSNQCSAKSGFYIGQTIWNLTIVEDLGIRRTEASRGKREVKTICKCGKEREVYLIKLKNGSIKACEKNCEFNLKNFTGLKFNKLLVIEEVEKNNQGKRRVLCKCDCGETAIKEISKLISGHTKYCGHKCILQTGKGSPSWNPNLSWEDRLKGRDYFEYKQWRLKVFQRDDFTCQSCEKRGKGNLVAHHKDAHHWCIERRIDVTNGSTLCEECHDSFHSNFGYQNNTEEQFKDWLIEIKKMTK